jgi:hypothetical protein
VQIIRGWRRIRDPKQQGDAVLRDLVAAASTPAPPVYAEGLRLLIDGLDILASSSGDNTELNRARERARHWGGSADWNCTLTILIGQRPDELNTWSLPSTWAIRERFSPDTARFS